MKRVSLCTLFVLLYIFNWITNLYQAYEATKKKLCKILKQIKLKKFSVNNIKKFQLIVSRFPVTFYIAKIIK